MLLFSVSKTTSQPIFKKISSKKLVSLVASLQTLVCTSIPSSTLSVKVTRSLIQKSQPSTPRCSSEFTRTRSACRSRSNHPTTGMQTSLSSPSLPIILLFVLSTFLSLVATLFGVRVTSCTIASRSPTKSSLRAWLLPSTSQASSSQQSEEVSRFTTSRAAPQKILVPSSRLFTPLSAPTQSQDGSLSSQLVVTYRTSMTWLTSSRKLCWSGFPNYLSITMICKSAFDGKTQTTLQFGTTDRPSTRQLLIMRDRVNAMALELSVWARNLSLIQRVRAEDRHWPSRKLRPLQSQLHEWWYHMILKIIQHHPHLILYSFN